MTITLSKTLLYLYECLTEPEHTEQMIETIGQWLSDEDNLLEVSHLEQHSQNVLKLLETQVKSTATQGDAADLTIPADTEPAEITAAITVAFGGPLQPSERSKIMSFLSSDAQHMVFQFSDTTTSHLCLLVKEKPDLKLWFREHCLNDAVENLLKQDLGLSNSEYLVLREIARGGKTTQIAERLHKSPETIKSQLKSIATKLGTSGQQGLQAEITRLDRFVSSSGIKAPEQSDDVQDFLILPDGRKLAYSIYGPQSGRPVLFFHCFLHGRHLPQDIQKHLQKSNTRIISMSRAGFGDSDLHPKDTANRLDVNSSDYAALSRHLNLGPAELFSHATGFASAFHFAIAYPELTTGLMGLDPVPPANSRARIQNLLGLFKSTSLAMAKAPATFNLMARFVFNRLSSFQDPNKKMRRHILYPSIPLDEIETVAGLDAATANVRDLMTHKLRQCVQEASAFRNDWAQVSADMNTKPQVRLYQTSDNPFVSKSGAEDLAETLGCDVVELANTFPFLTPHMDRLFPNGSDRP